MREAQRSPHNRHKTGAVIFTQDGYIHGKGCSHKHNGGLAVNSIHAERHALSRLPKDDWDGYCCLIVTLTKVGNFANLSRPCYDCAKALNERTCVVIYAERTNDGGWAIRVDSFATLLSGYLKPTKYA